jgi:hypothetical protein
MFGVIAAILFAAMIYFLLKKGKEAEEEKQKRTGKFTCKVCHQRKPLDKKDPGTISGNICKSCYVSKQRS